MEAPQPANLAVLDIICGQQLYLDASDNVLRKNQRETLSSNIHAPMLRIYSITLWTLIIAFGDLVTGTVWNLRYSALHKALGNAELEEVDYIIICQPRRLDNAGEGRICLATRGEPFAKSGRQIDRAEKLLSRIINIQALARDEWSIRSCWSSCEGEVRGWQSPRGWAYFEVKYKDSCSRQRATNDDPVQL